jgi:hypothetical protein
VGLLLVLVSLWTTATTGAAEFDRFKIESVAADLSTAEAARHPDFTTSVFLTPIEAASAPRVEDVVVDLPPGLYGNPTRVESCSTGDLLGLDCPVDSQIGVSEILLDGRPGFATIPVFNLRPVHPGQEIARFGMVAAQVPILIDVSVRTAGDYGVTAAARSSNGLEPLEAANVTIWGNPADSSHDTLRMTMREGNECSRVCVTEANPSGERASDLEPFAFMTNPSACQQGTVGFHVTSYQLPGQVFGALTLMDPITNCQGLPFDPVFEATPTSRLAGAPTGLNTTLRIPQTSDPLVPSTATMREARVSLPEGMTIAAGAADGIAACSDKEVGFHEEVDASCPDASKLGTAMVASPALPEPLEGAVYQRTPRPGHQFGLWLVTDALGLHVKIPGEIEPDPSSGQLTAVFRDLPQVATEEISIDIFGGPRAPLKNPDECGTYSTSFSFAPHSDDPAVSGRSQMTIDQGCDQGFSPRLDAGVTNPLAGAFSPFIFDLTRDDGQQSLRGFELTLPPGELAKLKGVGLCTDAGAAADACPTESRIGHVTAATGPGPSPLWLPQPGKAPTAIYLAGPYRGAPFSVVTAVPAQAGPFDLGVVAVRSALRVDPETAVATVEADPLPQFIEGVGIAYRRIRAVVDRAGFSLNPTNCSELAVRAKVTSNRGTVANASSRFQVDGCKALRFKPKLTLKLRGGRRRGDYPALSALLKARAGDANIGKVSVALPHSEFLAQEHLNTICTRKQFAVDRCPRGAVYGKVKAWTPLLAKPLSGPVYLRSSDNLLPDLVMDLRGELEIAVVGRLDTLNGGIRTSFETVPDAPITKFSLQMRGGRKSLLRNSVNICRGKRKATAKMRAHNGRILSTRPRLSVAGCAK